jgi:PAS domain S-box-containing protein
MNEREVFFERHPDPIWIYDLQTLEFLDVNAAALAVYGYERQEFLALKLTDIRPPEDVPAFPESIGTANHPLFESGPLRLRRKSGEVFNVQVAAQTIDWQGRRAKLVSIRAVSRSVQLEAEREGLLQREAALRRAAEEAAEQLADQNANLRTVQRLIGGGAWKYELWSGRLT